MGVKESAELNMCVEQLKHFMFEQKVSSELAEKRDNKRSS